MGDREEKASRAGKVFDKALDMMMSEYQKMSGTKILGVSDAIETNKAKLTEGMSEAFKNLVLQNDEFPELPSTEESPEAQKAKFNAIADCVIEEKHNPSSLTSQESREKYAAAFEALGNIVKATGDSKMFQLLASTPLVKSKDADALQERIVSESGPALGKALYKVQDEMRTAIGAETGSSKTQTVQASANAAKNVRPEASMEKGLGQFAPGNLASDGQAAAKKTTIV